jgi:hypothetical protein
VFPHFASFGRLGRVTLVVAAALVTFVTTAGPAPAAVPSGLVASVAGAQSSVHHSPGIPLKKASVPRQYQAVSSKIASSIAVWNCCQIPRLISVRNAGSRQAYQSQLARRAENARYQAVSRQYQDKELMLQIGLLLGLAYLAFLAIWVWATRLRPN